MIMGSRLLFSLCCLLLSIDSFPLRARRSRRWSFVPGSKPHTVPFPPMTTSFSSWHSRTRMNLSPAFKSITTLTLSAFIGRFLEKRLARNDSALLTTLAVAALLSNIGFAPSTHPIYDACSKLLLPSSLAFLLISLHQKNNESSKEAELKDTREAIGRVCIPFLLASVGSIVGCIVAFVVSVHTGMLSPDQASFAMSCLTASFIGGSVNYFATARLIGPYCSNAAKTLAGPMAAADLVVMAIYFAILSSLIQSKFIEKLFGGTTVIDDSHFGSEDFEKDITSQSNLETVQPTRVLSTCLVVIPTVLLIVIFANYIEDSLSGIIPGTACGIIAWMVPKLSTLILRSSALKERQGLVTRSSAWLSSTCFLLFFASIGVSADLSSALLTGPACLIVSFIAISTHLLFLLGSSLLAKRLIAPSLIHEEVLVGSNAAIGGSATAASFCSCLKYRDRKSMSIAATVWGIVGYAIGTTTGVAMYRLFTTKLIHLF